MFVYACRYRLAEGSNHEGSSLLTLILSAGSPSIVWEMSSLIVSIVQIH